MAHGSTVLLCIILGLGAAFMTGSNWIWPSLIGAIIIAVGSVVFRSKHYELFCDLKSVSKTAQRSASIIVVYMMLSVVQNLIFISIAAWIGFTLQRLF
jgi:LPXTG-motif cell wall-anchored protein